MKIQIEKIPPSGLHLLLHAKESWVTLAVKEALKETKPLLESIDGAINFNKVNDYISLNGNFKITLEVNCDRCVEGLQYLLEVPLRRNMSPCYHSDRGPKLAEEEEVELSTEDMEFSFYEGHEIDLGDILREELVLHLPTLFLCSPDCKGLCPCCGTNLNLSSCSCALTEPIDPRWEALKNLKPKSN